MCAFQLILSETYAGAQLEHANERGMTAALEAAGAGSLKTLQALHARGADLGRRNHHDDGAIELARWTRSGHEIRKWLRSVGVRMRSPGPRLHVRTNKCGHACTHVHTRVAAGVHRHTLCIHACGRTPECACARV
eukprot:6185767-Pleurochrysis_carterae.AAC.2